MKRVVAIAALLLVYLQSSAQLVKHVILISVDGFRPDFYMESSWGTPNLMQLKSDGVYANGVRGVFPSVTYPSHTTIITGAMPARHGIYYNEPFEPDGQTGRWYWEADSIKTPTLWDALHKAGLTSAAVSWPVTVNAPIDYNIPEIWSLGKDMDHVGPTREHTNPKTLFDEIQQNATGKLTNDDLNSEYLVMDEDISRIAAYLVRTYKPGLTAVHLVCVDHAEHGQGRNGTQVKKAIASADRAIGEIMEALKMAGIQDSTAVIVTGDHGFVDIHTTLAPNVWLAEHGLISKDNKSDWKAKFHTSGASAFLLLNDPNDTKTLREVKKILNDLPNGEKKLFRIVDKEELQKIGADPHAALALAPVQGISMTESDKGNAVRAAKGGTHGYYPDFKEIQTGFIAYGAPFAKGEVIPLMGLEDISPIIAKLLGLDFNAPDGVLYPGLFKPEKQPKN